MVIGITLSNKLSCDALKASGNLFLVCAAADEVDVLGSQVVEQEFLWWSCRHQNAGPGVYERSNFGYSILGFPLFDFFSYELKVTLSMWTRLRNWWLLRGYYPCYLSITYHLQSVHRWQSPLMSLVLQLFFFIHVGFSKFILHYQNNIEMSQSNVGLIYLEHLLHVLADCWKNYLNVKCLKERKTKGSRFLLSSLVMHASICPPGRLLRRFRILKVCGQNSKLHTRN